MMPFFFLQSCCRLQFFADNLYVLSFSLFQLFVWFFSRDTYDKEIKAKLTDKPKPKQNKQKKPDIHVYVPPTKLKGKAWPSKFYLLQDLGQGLLKSQRLLPENEIYNKYQ